MKYCARLLNEINFEPAALAPCCNTQNLVVPSMPYAGGDIDLNAYARMISSVLEEIQNGGAVCKGCRDLVEIDGMPAHGGKFRAISINMHRYYCNCKCVYCSLWKHGEKQKFYEVLPGLISLKSQNAIADNAALSWGGGEPGILPEFDRAAQWAFDNGYFQRIHSNAIRFSPVMADVISANRGIINISLDSASPEVYRRVKGVDKFAEVLSAISKYAAANPDNIELKYIVFEQNNSAAEVKNFINLAKNYGIRNLQLSFDFREQNKGVISEKTLAAAALLTLLAVQNGLNLTPFYVDARQIERIRAYIDEFSN